MSDSNKNLSIHFFQTGDFPEGNGANSRIKLIAKALTNHGFQVHLNYLWPSSFNQNKINTTKKGSFNGYRFRYLNYYIARPNNLCLKLIDSLYALFSSAFYILKNIKQIDVFFLYCPTFIYTIHIILLAKLAGKKIVIERTELFSITPQFNRNYKWKWVLPLKWLFRKSYKIDERYTHLFCNHLVVISEKLYKHYAPKMGKNRITLLPILVNVDKFAPSHNKITPLYTIGYLGSFGYKDGVPQLIEAFSKATEINPELRLKLIGYTDNIEGLNKTLAYYGVADKTEVPGQTKSDDIPALLHSCDLLVCNRINLPYAHYGSPTKVGEYLSTGIPTIISEVGDIKNYLTDEEAIFVEPDNTQQLTNAIVARYNEYETYNKIGLNGLFAASDNFSIEKNMNKLLQVIHTSEYHSTKI